MPGPRSIPTPYRSTLFRSKLEAEWAKNVSERLRLPWVSEPDGIRLPSGQGYLPDLWLPSVTIWIEVKGLDWRIHKPGELAAASVHDPRCGTGAVERPMLRPDGLPVADCECGFGSEFPWRLTLVGRPAVSGRMLWEPAQGEDWRNLVLVECPRRHRYTWVDLNGLPLCRCCHADVTGLPAIGPKRLPWLTIDTTRGARAAKNATGR